MNHLQLKLRIRFRPGVERIGVFGAFTGQSYPDLWEVLWGGELIASFRSWGDAVSSNVGADAAGDVVRDGDGFEYDTVIDGAKPQKAKVRRLRTNPTGGAV
jgi:hypothetical protein